MWMFRWSSNSLLSMERQSTVCRAWPRTPGRASRARSFRAALRRIARRVVRPGSAAATGTRARWRRSAGLRPARWPRRRRANCHAARGGGAGSLAARRRRRATRRLRPRRPPQSGYSIKPGAECSVTVPRLAQHPQQRRHAGVAQCVSAQVQQGEGGRGGERSWQPLQPQRAVR